MKALFFLFIYALSNNLVYAQLEHNGSNSNSVGKTIGRFEAPATTVNKPETIAFGTSNGFKTANKKQNEKQKKEAKTRQLLNKGILSDATIAKERFSKNYKKINGQYAIIDQDLGSFQNNGKYVTIYCRDFQHPDNDRVTVYHNNIPIIYNIVLKKRFQSFKIPLEKGINKIAFKALNQGTSGPNTAGFKVYDDSGTLISSNQWELATGAKATISISKAE